MALADSYRNEHEQAEMERDSQKPHVWRLDYESMRPLYQKNILSVFHFGYLKGTGAVSLVTDVEM